MSLVVSCPECDKKLKVADEQVGHRVKCSCGHVFRAQGKPAARAVAVQAPAEKVVVACDECGSKLKVASTTLGKKTKCPKCDAVFVAAVATAPATNGSRKPAARPVVEDEAAKPRRAAPPPPPAFGFDDEEEAPRPKKAAARAVAEEEEEAPWDEPEPAPTRRAAPAAVEAPAPSRTMVNLLVALIVLAYAGFFAAVYMNMVDLGGPKLRLPQPKQNAAPPPLPNVDQKAIPAKTPDVEKGEPTKEDKKSDLPADKGEPDAKKLPEKAKGDTEKADEPAPDKKESSSTPDDEKTPELVPSPRKKTTPKVEKAIDAPEPADDPVPEKKSVEKKAAPDTSKDSVDAPSNPSVETPPGLERKEKTAVKVELKPGVRIEPGLGANSGKRFDRVEAGYVLGLEFARLVAPRIYGVPASGTPMGTLVNSLMEMGVRAAPAPPLPLVVTKTSVKTTTKVAP